MLRVVVEVLRVAVVALPLVRLSVPRLAAGLLSVVRLLPLRVAALVPGVAGPLAEGRVVGTAPVLRAPLVLLFCTCG